MGQEPASVDNGGHQTNYEWVIGESCSKDRHDGVDIPKAVSHEKETDVQRVDEDIMAEISRDRRRDVILGADSEQIRKEIAKASDHRCSCTVDYKMKSGNITRYNPILSIDICHLICYPIVNLY